VKTHLGKFSAPVDQVASLSKRGATIVNCLEGVDKAGID